MINRSSMVATSARLALPPGSRTPPLLPLIRPVATAHCMASAAQGETRIGDIFHIQRGYEDPVRDLGLLGARITLEEE